MMSEKDAAALLGVARKAKVRLAASVDIVAGTHTCLGEAVVAAARRCFGHVDRGLREMPLTPANSTVVCDILEDMADSCVLLPSGQVYLSRSHQHCCRRKENIKMMMIKIK